MSNNSNMSMPQLTSPETFMNTMNTLTQQLPPMLDNFQRYYVFYNTNPNYPEYIQMFSSIKANLNNMNTQMFALNNEVESNMNTLSSSMLTLNANIQQLKSENDIMSKNDSSLQQLLDSSNELISNYSQLYDESYLKNWGIFLSIGFSILLIKIIFKKPNMPNVN
jgi:outer membrane murein-binding lipoprotein Lpp